MDNNNITSPAFSTPLPSYKHRNRRGLSADFLSKKPQPVQGDTFKPQAKFKHNGQVLSWSTFYNAITSGNVNKLAELLKNETVKSNIDKLDTDGRTGLCYAAINAKVNIAKLLLDKGAKVDQIDEKGYTPLCHAIMSYRKPPRQANEEDVRKEIKNTVELLINRKADLNAHSPAGTPLQIARNKKLPEIAALLIDKGANEVDEEQCVATLYAPLPEKINALNLIIPPFVIPPFQPRNASLQLDRLSPPLKNQFQIHPHFFSEETFDRYQPLTFPNEQLLVTAPVERQVAKNRKRKASFGPKGHQSAEKHLAHGTAAKVPLASQGGLFQEGKSAKASELNPEIEALLDSMDPQDLEDFEVFIKRLDPELLKGFAAVDEPNCDRPTDSGLVEEPAFHQTQYSGISANNPFAGVPCFNTKSDFSATGKSGVSAARKGIKRPLSPAHSQSESQNKPERPNARTTPLKEVPLIILDP